MINSKQTKTLSSVHQFNDLVRIFVGSRLPLFSMCHNKIYLTFFMFFICYSQTILRHFSKPYNMFKVRSLKSGMGRPPPPKPTSHKGGQINGGPSLQCKKKCNPYVKRKITRSGHRTFATPSHFINVILLFSCDPMIILLLQNIKPRYVLISIYKSQK